MFVVGGENGKNTSSAYGLALTMSIHFTQQKYKLDSVNCGQLGPNESRHGGVMIGGDTRNAIGGRRVVR